MSRDTTVIPFRQPEVIDDPLSELAREGARRRMHAGADRRNTRRHEGTRRLPDRGPCPELARASHRHQAAWARDCAGPGGRQRRARLLEGDRGGLSEHQRCWVHKTANVLNKVALAVQVNMKADLREIYERGAGRPQTRLTPGTTVPRYSRLRR
jgi:hypothetical protein